jgi:hypothetical protein
MGFGTINLLYTKQSDDMKESLAFRQDGSIDVKYSIQNHISLLSCAIEQLNRIYDLITDDVIIEINEENNTIGLFGSNYLIENLSNENLLYKN